MKIEQERLLQQSSDVFVEKQDLQKELEATKTALQETTQKVN